MTILATILCLALTRAEIIERMKAPPIVKLGGLVEVIANCPADMRDEFQMPVATFVADTCKALYTVSGEREKRFERPGIIVSIGDVRTNLTTVATRVVTRDGAKVTRITIPAPGHADMRRLGLETAKAFSRAVNGAEIDDATALRLLRASDPATRTDDMYAELAAWQNAGKGAVTEEDDDRMLKLARSVLEPGVAREADVLRFASRLFLYPEVYSSPFCREFTACTFREAITMARRDPRIRFIAFERMPLIVVYGGGHGEELQEAATAYAEFLRALAVYTKSEKELGEMLDAADAKLQAALEAARKFEKGEM